MILKGIVAGIGFIGGGTIGKAVAYVPYDIALFLSIADFIFSRWLTPLKEKISNHE